MNWKERDAEGRKRRVKTAVRALAVLLVVIPLWACGKKIGDACRVSDDCIEEDPSRTCDTSQPGGYCTLMGCEERTCPDESVCMRFFPVDNAATCTPGRAPAESECALLGRDYICLDTGVCVKRFSERRWCVLRCGDSGDCRDDYQCRPSGNPRSGDVALTTRAGAQAKYCAPRAPR